MRNNYFLFKKYLILFSLIFFCSVNIANPEAENFFTIGNSYYEQKKYELAIEPLEKAVELDPNNAQYQHVLAKNYGRSAEQANWFRAMNLAQKTLDHLKIAADLDKYNVEILDDLMDYYREAPAFLGGDTKKADEIEALIDKLSQNQPNNDN